MEHPDQIAHHMLQVTHSYLTMVKKNGGAGGGGKQGDAMMHGQHSNFSRLQNEIIEYVKKANQSGSDANISGIAIFFLFIC